MGSEAMTSSTDLTWREIITCLLIGAAFVSAYWNLVLFTISWGLSAVAMAMLSVSESIRLARSDKK
jgi:hypothetical protein